MGPLNLSSLVRPLTASEFLEKHWPYTPHVTHNLGPLVGELMTLPYLRSVEDLLRVWPLLVSVHLPDASDESSSIEVTPDHARKLFKNNMALLFNNVNSYSSELQLALEAIKTDLGLPQSTISRCMLYATPDGRGTAPHFDQNVNFVIQLHGTKTWWIEPNVDVENPTERFTMGQPMDPELKTYANPQMPSKMSEARQKIVLKPGSFLFVPRGYWHSTEASGEALALNFTFSQPCWADLMTMALRSRLVLSADWRELADGVTSKDENRRAQAVEKFDLLLRELIDDLPHWSAQDILGSTEGL